MATGACDGSVVVQASSLAEGGRGSSSIAAHAAAGGATAVAAESGGMGAAAVTAVGFDATGQWLASGAADGSIFIYTNTGKITVIRCTIFLICHRPRIVCRNCLFLVFSYVFLGCNACAANLLALVVNTEELQYVVAGGGWPGL